MKSCTTAGAAHLEYHHVGQVLWILKIRCVTGCLVKAVGDLAQYLVAIQGTVISQVSFDFILQDVALSHSDLWDAALRLSAHSYGFVRQPLPQFPRLRFDLIHAGSIYGLNGKNPLHVSAGYIQHETTTSLVRNTNRKPVTLVRSTRSKYAVTRT